MPLILFDYYLAALQIFAILRSSLNTILELPQGNMLSSFGDGAFSIAAPKLWKALPSDLPNSSSLGTGFQIMPGIPPF